MDVEDGHQQRKPRPMPVYFLQHLRNGHPQERQEGRQFGDLDEAIEVAAALETESRQLNGDQDVKVAIVDEGNRVIATASGRVSRNTEDVGHPSTTTGSGKFQQPVLRGDNKLHIDPATALPNSPEVQTPNGGSPGTNAQTADLGEA
jgi:hypothetical protein